MALIQASVFSNCLRRFVNFNAILPVDTMFAPLSPKKPLKTMYILHGYTCNCDTWLTSSVLGDISAQNNLAIIMPSGENHFYVDNPKSMAMHGEFIGRELVSLTRKMFPLSENVEDTIIAGISMGGFGAMRNGLKYSDTFGHIISISPALITEQLPAATDAPNLIGVTRGYFESVFGDLETAVLSDLNPAVLAKELSESGSPFPNTYLACGKNDVLVLGSRKFSGLLDSLGVKHCYEEGPGTHDSAFFDLYLKRGVERLGLSIAPPPQNPFWFEEK